MGSERVAPHAASRRPVGLPRAAPLVQVQGGTLVHGGSNGHGALPPPVANPQAIIHPRQSPARRAFIDEGREAAHGSSEAPASGARPSDSTAVLAMQPPSSSDRVVTKKESKRITKARESYAQLAKVRHRRTSYVAIACPLAAARGN